MEFDWLLNRFLVYRREKGNSVDVDDWILLFRWSLRGEYNGREDSWDLLDLAERAERAIARELGLRGNALRDVCQGICTTFYLIPRPND